jgi:hypothetical protein
MLLGLQSPGLGCAGTRRKPIRVKADIRRPIAWRDYLFWRPQHYSRFPAAAARRRADFLIRRKTFAGWEEKSADVSHRRGAIVGGNLQTKIPNNEFLCTTKGTTSNSA